MLYLIDMHGITLRLNRTFRKKDQDFSKYIWSEIKILYICSPVWNEGAHEGPGASFRGGFSKGRAF